MDKIDTASHTNTTLILTIPLDTVPADTALVIDQGNYLLAQEIVDRQIYLLLGTIHKAHIIGNIRYRVKGVGIVLAQAGSPGTISVLRPNRK